MSSNKHRTSHSFACVRFKWYIAGAPLVSVSPFVTEIEIVPCSNQLCRRQMWCCPLPTGIRSEVLAGPRIVGAIGAIGAIGASKLQGTPLWPWVFPVFPVFPIQFLVEHLSASQGLVCKTFFPPGQHLVIYRLSDEFKLSMIQGM